VDPGADVVLEDVHVWQPTPWQHFIARRRQWTNELFDYLG
jgi:hypothetical protein